MSGDDTGKVLCATTSSVAGCVVLPNTGSDPIMTAFSVVAIAAGLIVLVSLVVTRLSAKLSR